MHGARRKSKSDADKIVAAIDRLSENMGKWLGAIALAASTPTDNSEEVKAQLARLDTSATNLKDAVEAAQPPVVE